jgi:porin
MRGLKDCGISGALSVALLFETSLTSTAADLVPEEPQLSIWDQATLTGDWFGAGPSMREAGFDVRLEWAQFYQGFVEGDGRHDWDYGGQFSLQTRLDLSRMGLWDGLSVTAQGLFNYGDSGNGAGGTLLPVNSTLFFPGIDGADSSDLAALYVSQQFGETTNLSVGKIYTAELARGVPLRGGGGTDTFWNLNFAAPLSGLTPPTINGALFRTSLQPVSFAAMIYDTQDATNQPLFSDLFENGVTFNGTATLATRVAGRSGFYSIKGIYSTIEGTDFSQIIKPPGLPPGTKKGSWLLGVSFQQFIVQSEEDPRRGWGVFGEANIADGNPNILEWSMNLGVAGNGLFPNRPDDRFGIGYYYTGISKDLRDELAPVFNLDDEAGVEAFYNVAITPWFRVTADAQLIDPGFGNFADDIFVGIGSYIKF